MTKAEKELFLDAKKIIESMNEDIEYLDYPDSLFKNTDKLNKLIDKLIEKWREPKDFAITPSDLLKTIEHVIKVEIEGGNETFTAKLIDKLIELIPLFSAELLGRLMYKTEYEFCKRGLNK